MDGVADRERSPEKGPVLPVLPPRPARVVSAGRGTRHRPRPPPAMPALHV